MLMAGVELSLSPASEAGSNAFSAGVKSSAEVACRPPAVPPALSTRPVRAGRTAM